MNKRVKSQRTFWCLLPSFTRRSLILLLSAVFLSSVAATRSTSVQIAQRSEATSQQATHAAAQRLFDEGFKLYEEGTAESLRQAIEKFKQALPLWRQVGDKAGEATTLLGIGRIYDDLGDKQQALKYYNQSLPLSRQVSNKRGEGTTLNNIGSVYDNLGDKQQALNKFNQSLPLSRQVGDKSQEGGTLSNIGLVYDNLGDKQQALKFFNQSLPLSRQVGDKAGEATTLYNIAKVERDKGNLQQALTQIQAAIKIIEDLRTKIDSQDLRTSYFASQQDVYKFYIDLLMQLHKKDPSKGYNALALHASESSRARGLIELLTEARANIRKGVNPQLVEEEKGLQFKIEATGKLLQELSSKPQTETAQENFKKQLETLLTQQKELQTKIRTNSPKYAALQYPQPLKLPQIQQQLDKDTLLLEYSLGKDHSYLWAVTPNSIDTYEFPKREEIEKAVTEFRNDLQHNRAGDSTAINATKLSKIILAPVADKLGKKRLVIVADGGLQKIPFAALNDLTPSVRQKGGLILVPSPRKGGVEGEVNYQPLIVNHEIVNLPSVTTIATQRQDLKGRKTAPHPDQPRTASRPGRQSTALTGWGSAAFDRKNGTQAPSFKYVFPGF